MELQAGVWRSQGEVQEAPKWIPRGLKSKWRLSTCYWAILESTRDLRGCPLGVSGGRLGCTLGLHATLMRPRGEFQEGTKWAPRRPKSK